MPDATSSDLTPPSFADIIASRQRIAPYLAPTPLFGYPSLDEYVGTEVLVKHEDQQPVGAFKVRGGVNLVAQLPIAQRRRGLIAASTGNHGQSIAFAGRLFGVPVRIVVPEAANPGKVAAIRGMGADVILHGERFDDAVRHCVGLAEEHGYRYVHSGNEPHLIAGVATLTVEMLESRPDIDVIFVPLGMGSGAAAASLTAKAVNPAIRVIAVQSAQSPAGYLSWRHGKLLTALNTTFAEGLATGSAAALPQAIIAEHLDEFVLVSDREIRSAMVAMIEHAHTLAEGAAAAALAAAVGMRESLADQTVAIICTGGNTSITHLREALADNP